MKLGAYDVTNTPLVELNLTCEQFIGIPHTMNVYCLAAVEPPVGPAQLLVAATKKLFLLKCNDAGELVKQQVDVPCLDASCDVVSLAAYIDHFTGELHYAFTTAFKAQAEGDEVFSLHVHQERQACQEVLLPTRPYQLLAATVPCTGGHQVVWVVTGAQVVVVGLPVGGDDDGPGDGQDGSLNNNALGLSADDCVRDDRDHIHTDDDDDEEEDDEDEEEDEDGDEEEEEYEDDEGSRRYGSDVPGPEKPLRKRFVMSPCKHVPLETGSGERSGKTKTLFGDEVTGAGRLSPDEREGRYCLLNPSLFFPELLLLNYRVLRLHCRTALNGCRLFDWGLESSSKF
ncbi:46 kDa FK506-binding nuclear protein [Hyalella azteca]|uniref:46 kDa FK506-binding nuclear protein n=1 Tax=Hyalella azteca TaxID=294128 RepID=A0A979FIP9_HYAAZ|nr:46 kDa FK506-binding nuclear protein [Hyalella azteca]